MYECTTPFQLMPYKCIKIRLWVRIDKFLEINTSGLF
jgi:hypothetical protein